MANTSTNFHFDVILIDRGHWFISTQNTRQTKTGVWQNCTTETVFWNNNLTKKARENGTS